MPALFQAMHAMKNRCRNWCGELRKRWVRWRVAVFNIGANVRFGITETTERVYRKVWEMGAYAGFLMGREVASVMLPRKRGTILFTGATASMRGGQWIQRICRGQIRPACACPIHGPGVGA